LAPVRQTVTVIVPHYEALDDLDRCLSALERQTYPRERIAIVVADNASPCGLGAVESAVAGRAQVVEVTTRGAAAARNGAIDHATGEILAFTDSDCIPCPAWLEQGVAALDQYDLVGGRMVVSAADEANVSATEAFEKIFAFDNAAYVAKKHFSVTANLFCRRDHFRLVGPFRAEVSEDRDWCLRARAAGLRIGYAAGAIVVHPGRRDWPELQTKLSRLNRETLAWYSEAGFGRARWLLRSLLLPASAVVHTPKVVFTRRLSTLREKAGALRILYRSRWWRFGHALAIAFKPDLPGASKGPKRVGMENRGI